jgi:hypothetical protein
LRSTTLRDSCHILADLNYQQFIQGFHFYPCRLLRKKLAKGEFVKKNAPDYCEVSIIHESKKIMDGQHGIEPVSSCPQRPDVIRNSEKKFFELACFSGKLK